MTSESSNCSRIGIIMQRYSNQTSTDTESESMLACELVCTQSCPALCGLEKRSPPVSSDYGILQTRMQEWSVISSPRGASWPRGQARIPCVPCTGRFFITSTTWEALLWIKIAYVEPKLTKSLNVEWQDVTLLRSRLLIHVWAQTLFRSIWGWECIYIYVYIYTCMYACT